MNDEELGIYIARAIFKAGVLHGEDPSRIAYMMGRSPERIGAGWGEGPLADFITKTLKKRPIKLHT